MIRLFLPLTLVGCAQGGQARWAMDTWLVDPVGPDLSAVTTWDIFGPDWESNQRPGTYVCTVAVQWSGTAVTGCDRCGQAWALEALSLESDCSDPVASHPLFAGIAAIGVGSVASELDTEEGPADPAIGSYLLTEDGWAPHGWGTPAAGDGDRWDGTTAFTLWPAYAWELAEPQ